MGLFSIAEFFQQVTEHLIRDIRGIEYAMDDIPIHYLSRKLTIKVLRILIYSGLTFNKENCAYSHNSAMFLDCIVINVRFQVDPGKVQTINDVNVPENVTPLQCFMRMVTYLFKFVKKL